MGEVYRADDLKLAQPVALKFLPEKLSKSRDALARFHAEVRTARSDRKGAFRLAALIFALSLPGWLIGASHVPI